MTHLYWTIVCKNERCGMRHEIEYIGESLNLGTFHGDNKNPRTITSDPNGNDAPEAKLRCEDVKLKALSLCAINEEPCKVLQGSSLKERA